MNKRLEWNSVERQCAGDNPWIETYECVIGTDSNGVEWRARCRYMPDEHRFHVWFDNMEEHETKDHGWSTPFLRTEVVYADFYWIARDEYYQVVKCDYHKISKEVKKFAERHNIN